MISSDSCKSLVAGNYDVLIHEDHNADIRTINAVITDFLKRFEQLEAQLVEPNNEYVSEFQLLKNFSETLKEDRANLVDGEKTYNQRKNRYKDIIPFSHTRVILSEQPDRDPGSNYINANYIRGPTGSPNAYIACQGPLDCTLVDFWRMIWECKVSVIVMACNEKERNKRKCEIYWPEEVNSSSIYGSLHITLLRKRQINEDFLIRKLLVKLLKPLEESRNVHIGDHGSNDETSIEEVGLECVDGQASTNHNDSCTNQSNSCNKPAEATKDLLCDRVVLMERTIAQFHYTTWPDHGVPTSVQPILELVRLMREVQPEEDKPILVHCSAGCGRTGTICCIDYVWGLLRSGKLGVDFSLFSIINQMRQQRMAMVQSLAQYILCHRAVAALFMNQLELVEIQSENQETDKPGSVVSTNLSDEESTFAAALSDDNQEFGPVFI